MYNITKDDKVFWIEVKDKAQRVFFQDTGADLHQVLGWYDINENLKEPVLVIFKDPDYLSCLPKSKNTDEDVIARFKKRWDKFNGDYYGNWLTSLLKIDKTLKYPCIFSERSRDIDMNILYFHINKMVKIEENISKILKEIPSSIDKIECYRRNQDKSKTKILEETIRGMSI